MAGDTTTMRQPQAPWRIGVDVGGTFTDLVLADATGATWVAKVPSVPADPSRGVLAAAQRVAADLSMPMAHVLQQCALFVHGSTIATNTMLEGKGARVGLIATEGFRDTLEIRRGLREDQFNHRQPYAPVLVPRYLRKSIPGRMDFDGTEHQPLDLNDLGDIIADFEHGRCRSRGRGLAVLSTTVRNVPADASCRVRPGDHIGGGLTTWGIRAHLTAVVIRCPESSPSPARPRIGNC